jgi:hypothetical protein
MFSRTKDCDFVNTLGIRRCNGAIVLCFCLTDRPQISRGKKRDTEPP